MFEVGVVAQFEAAHRLRGDFGAAIRLHGHTYRVEVIARGHELREDGTLCDITVVRGALDGVLEALHYRNLDDVESFERRNTTAEVVAQYLWEEIASSIRGRGLSSLAVRVWESPQVFAALDREL
jgi:6-pyruvoyltetrahydropterin/6-carboxytetrahydropterin synthase